MAFSANEKKFLAAVKGYKLTALKKNKDAELIAIARTMCGDTYYATTLADIYKRNHYVSTAKSDKVLVAQASKYLCAQKVTVVYDDGTSSTVTIYDQSSTTVVDAGTVEASGSDVASALANAAKQPTPRPKVP